MAYDNLMDALVVQPHYFESLLHDPTHGILAFVKSKYGVLLDENAFAITHFMRAIQFPIKNVCYFQFAFLGLIVADDQVRSIFGASMINDQDKETWTVFEKFLMAQHKILRRARTKFDPTSTKETIQKFVESVLVLGWFQRNTQFMVHHSTEPKEFDSLEIKEIRDL